jgi:hypothetical protein
VAVQFWVVPHLALGAAQARAHDADGAATAGAGGPVASGGPASGSEWDLLERAAGIRRVEPDR